MNNIIEFREYIIAAVKNVFEVAKSHGHELMPVAFIVREKDTAILPIGHFMENDLTKDLLMDALRELTAVKDVVGIGMVNEIWTASTTITNPDFTPPSQRPDRGEAALIRLEFRGSNVELWKADIVNRTLGEFVSVPCDDGRMAQRLFPAPTEH